MININIIAKELDDFAKLNKKEVKQAFIPITYDGDLNKPDFCVQKTNRKNLSKILAFTDYVKYCRLKNDNTIIPIPTTNDKLLSIWGTSKSISRAVVLMVKMGLISVYDDSWEIGSLHRKDGKGKLYVYWIDNEKLFREYCERKLINTSVIPTSLQKLDNDYNNKHRYYYRNIDNNDNINNIINNNVNNNVNNIINNSNNNYDINNNKNYSLIDTLLINNEIDSFDGKSVKFSSSLHLLRPDNFTKQDMEEYVTQKLYDNYPALEYFQNLANDINNRYYTFDYQLQTRYRPKFHWRNGKRNGSTSINKIGIRATNSLCNLKKEIDEYDDRNTPTRKAFIRERGYNLEFDVKASVPALTYALNHGEWVGKDTDLYKAIFDEYVKIKKLNDTTFDLKWNKTVRNSIKKLHMRAYFDSPTTIARNTANKMTLENCTREEVKEEMWIFQQAVKNAEGGKLYDSEIFFHESNVYMLVLKSLLDLGFRVYQVYDGFYAKKPGVSREEFEELVYSLVVTNFEWYYDTFIAIRIRGENKEEKTVENTVYNNENIEAIFDDLTVNIGGVEFTLDG